jgi:HNH endonuclease
MKISAEVQWRRVPDVEELEVTDYGQTRRHAFFVRCIRRGKEMEQLRPASTFSPCLSNHGYPEIATTINGVRRKFFVHRLVGRAWVPGYAEGLTINHIDGIKENNHASNLEWVTRARNTELQWETGLVNLRGDNHPSRKLSSGKVRIIRDLIEGGATCNQLAVLLDLSPCLLYLIRDGKRWSELASLDEVKES